LEVFAQVTAKMLSILFRIHLCVHAKAAVSYTVKL